MTKEEVQATLNAMLVQRALVDEQIIALRNMIKGFELAEEKKKDVLD